MAAQPLLGEHAERAVVEDDARLAAAQGLEQPRQGHALPLEVHLRLEVEPVDPGRDAQAHRPRPAVDAPLGLDVPALARERHHDRAEAARRQAPRPVRLPLEDRALDAQGSAGAPAGPARPRRRGRRRAAGPRPAPPSRALRPARRRRRTGRTARPPARARGRKPRRAPRSAGAGSGPGGPPRRAAPPASRPVAAAPSTAGPPAASPLRRSGTSSRRWRRRSATQANASPCSKGAARPSIRTSPLAVTRAGRSRVRSSPPRRRTPSTTYRPSSSFTRISNRHAPPSSQARGRGSRSLARRRTQRPAAHRTESTRDSSGPGRRKRVGPVVS